MHTHRTKSVSVERALGGGTGGRHGSNDEGEEKDTQNESEFYGVIEINIIILIHGVYILQ